MNANDRNINALQFKTFSAQQSENSALLYTINYASLLGSDTISTSEWSGNLTISNKSNTTTTAIAKLSASPGRYKSVNKIVTAAGETYDRIISLHVTRNDTSLVVGDYE